MELCLASVPNSYSVKRGRVDALAGEIDTLVLGASNAYAAIVPGRMPGSAFNLANVAQTLYYDDQILTRVLPTLPRLKHVILTAGYGSLFVQVKRGAIEDWRQYYYAQEWDIPPRVWHERLDLRMWSRLALAWPPLPIRQAGIGLRTFITGDVPDADADMDARGWHRTVGAGDMSDRRAAATLARHHADMSEAHIGDNVGYLEHMISILAERDVEVTLVTLPVWRSYRNGMREDVWNRALEIYTQLAERHGIAYLCFLHAPGLEWKHFRNPDHLNQAGAARFSDMLAVAITSGYASSDCPLR
jgi:hypothetical protein